jgi:hypothetical protein
MRSPTILQGARDRFSKNHPEVVNSQAKFLVERTTERLDTWGRDLEEMARISANCSFDYAWLTAR